MSKKRRDTYFNQSEENYEENFGYDDDLLPEQRDNRWELEENEIVAEFRRDFKGLLSQKGLDDISIWMRVALNRHLALSNLEDKEIKQIVLNQCRTLNKMIVLEGENWGLENDGRRDQLKNFIKELLLVHLKRAYKDGERIYRSNTYRGVHGFEDNNKKNSTSLGGLFANRKQEKRQTNSAQRDIYDDEQLDEDEVTI